MKEIDPRALFDRIAREVPTELHKHLFVVGSLAAARFFTDELAGRGVRTKDADLVIYPAGNIVSAREVATRLLELGWRRKDDCYAQASQEPVDTLRAIRLYPPEGNDYFIELLSVPRAGQRNPKQWLGLKLDDGWYGLPSFEFLGLTAIDRERSDDGIEYAAPCMMALANLLAHPTIGTARMSTPLGGREILRSAKDLGRVLALARLAQRTETERWWKRWQFALKECLPNRYDELAGRVGIGLRELLGTASAFEEAWYSCDVGLLSGKNVALPQLKATADRFLVDAIEPLEATAKVL